MRSHNVPEIDFQFHSTIILQISSCCVPRMLLSHKHARIDSPEASYFDRQKTAKKGSRDDKSQSAPSVFYHGIVNSQTRECRTCAQHHLFLVDGSPPSLLLLLLLLTHPTSAWCLTISIAALPSLTETCPPESGRKRPEIVTSEEALRSIHS